MFSRLSLFAKKIEDAFQPINNAVLMTGITYTTINALLDQFDLAKEVHVSYRSKPQHNPHVYYTDNINIAESAALVVGLGCLLYGYYKYFSTQPSNSMNTDHLRKVKTLSL